MCVCVCDDFHDSERKDDVSLQQQELAVDSSVHCERGSVTQRNELTARFQRSFFVSQNEMLETDEPPSITPRSPVVGYMQTYGQSIDGPYASRPREWNKIINGA